MPGIDKAGETQYTKNYISTETQVTPMAANAISGKRQILVHADSLKDMMKGRKIWDFYNNFILQEDLHTAPWQPEYEYIGLCI